MERLCIFIVCISIAATTHAIPSDAVTYSRRSKLQVHGPTRNSISESLKKLKLQMHMGINPQVKFFTVEPNAVSVNSPFSLPPFDSLAPIPLPVTSPPYCENAPPQTPLPPAAILPPESYFHSPPPPPLHPNGPGQSPPPNSPSIVPMPPSAPLVPNPPENMSSPTPPTGTPSPPHHYWPSPPRHVPGPPNHGPSSPVFLPPVVHPPPSAPPPPHRKPRSAAWCVAKPTVPDPIIQEAMDYACGSGADCKSIQPNGHCFEPDTILAHASYAFNSYWQNTKVTGGTCDFGGTAMLVTVDPSFEGCKFVLN